MDNGVRKEGDYVRIPDTMTSCQRIKLTEALTLIENNPDVQHSNPVFQSLKRTA